MAPLRTIKSPEFNVQTLEEAREIVNRVSTTDVYAQPSNLRLLASGCLEANGHVWPLSEFGFETLCKRLSIPLTYASRIPIDLLRANVNRLIRELHSEILVRAQDWVGMETKAVTCIARGAYRPARYSTILNCLSNAANKDGFRIERVSLSPPLFRAELTLGAEKNLLPGDPFRFGCEITASENAWSQTVSAHLYALRLVCTNGLVAPRSFEFMSFRPGRQTTQEDVSYFLERAISRVRAGVGQVEEVLRGMVSLKITEEHSSWLYHRLRRRLSKRVLESFMPEQLGERTYYEVLNHITAQSHSGENIFRQRFFQLLGGELLELAFSRN